LIAIKCAKLALKKPKSATKIGLLLFTLFAAVTTLTTSNDIVVLTLTPITLIFIE